MHGERGRLRVSPDRRRLEIEQWPQSRASQRTVRSGAGGCAGHRSASLSCAQRSQEGDTRSAMRSQTAVDACSVCSASYQPTRDAHASQSHESVIQGISIPDGMVASRTRCRR